VGAQDLSKAGGNTAFSTLSGTRSHPTKLFQTYSKLMNPEEDDSEDKWEEDTNDTEIIRNINSLLDSGKPRFNKICSIDLYDYKNPASAIQISY
jgi:hypothetical protein